MSPYYERDGITIFCGDCREILPALGSFDLCLVDPPYGIDYQSAWRIDHERKSKIANDKTPAVEFIQDLDAITCLCFCRWDVSQAFRTAFDEAGWSIKSEVVWDRITHGMGDLNGSFAPQHDTVWFATHDDYQFPGKRPTSVVRIPRVPADKMLHPNEKPVALMQHFLAFIGPSSVIDPYCGSGTTLVAAKLAGIKATGIELSERYCEIAANRLAQGVLAFTD